jgi:long-subunit acyl-CoA synthetase (AMP-forming)
MTNDTMGSLHNLVSCLLYWEKTKPDAVYLTQPYADGRVVDYTWREVAEQARRGATYLRSLNFPQGSNIGILGKNSAHWIIADLAIWLAGHVSVPLYPAHHRTETVHDAFRPTCAARGIDYRCQCIIITLYNILILQRCMLLH